MFAKSTQIDCVGEILVPRESDRKPSHAAISAKPSFAIGNAIAEGRRGWFIGQFFPADAGLLSQSTIEVKWGQHQKGACRANFAASRFGGTISVLISGHFLLKLMVDGAMREIALTDPGDYAAFGAGVPHWWQALEDSLVISIRFPSIEGNQIELPWLD